MSQDQRAGVAHKVVRGGMLLMLGQVFARLTGLVSIAVLARLLAPEDYGIVALAMVFIGLADTVTNIQIGSAILRIPDPTPEHFDTAFTISFLRGALIAVTLCAISGLVASYYDDWRIAGVMIALALSPFIVGAANPRLILFEKALDFRAILFLSLAVTLTGAVATIACAVVLRNYWALVLGTLLSVIVNVTIGYMMLPYRPRISFRYLREYLSFGGWLTAANIFAYADYKMDVLLVGARLGSHTLGLYSMGDRISQMMSNELAAPFVRAFLPGLTSVAHDPARLRQAYHRSQEMLLATMLPVGVGLALCSREAVLIVAGPKWTTAALIVTFMAPMMSLNTMTSAVQALTMTMGNTRAFFMRNVANFVLRVPIMITGLYFFGLIGILVAGVVNGFIFTLTSLALAAKQTGDTFWQPFLNSWRTLASCLGMTIAVLALRLVLPDAGTDWTASLMNLLALAAWGGAVYIAMHYALWCAAGQPDGAERTIINQVVILLRDRLVRKQAAQANNILP